MGLKHHSLKLAMLPLAVAALLSMASCHKRTVCYDYRPTPVEGWEPTDTLTFNIDSIPHTGRYTLHLGIRISTAYPFPFKTLWVVMKQRWNNALLNRQDTIACDFTTPNGDMTGHGTSLLQYDYYIDTISLNQGDRGYITIMHAMMRDILPGISDVGIKLVSE